MLERKEKAELVWAAMSLEILEYNSDDMWLLFKQWLSKTPEQIDECLEFLRITSYITFKLYCEIIANFQLQLLKIKYMASNQKYRDAILSSEAVTFKL
jgi:hypothetical protein